MGRPHIDFAKYLDLVEVIFVTLSSDGKVTFVNSKGCEILGYSREELLGKDWFETFVPGDERSSAWEVFKTVFSGKTEGAPYYENNVITQSGEKRLIAWHNSFARDEKGKIVQSVSIGRDITEFRELKKQKDELVQDLKERNKELDCLFEILLLGEEPRTELRDILKAIPAIVKNACRYPEKTAVRVVLDEQVYMTAEAEGDKTVLSEPIKIKRRKRGQVQLAAIEDSSDEYSPEFLAEELKLLKAVADTVGRMAERYEAEELLEERAERLSRLTRQLQVLSDANQLMVRVDSEQELLDGVCRILVEEGHYKFAWIGFAEKNRSRTVKPVAKHGEDKGYLDKIRLSWGDNKYGSGPVGVSLRALEPKVIRSTEYDSGFKPWKKEAVERGFRSAAFLPFGSAEKELFGSLNIYSSKVDAFDEAEMRVLTELADDLSYGIKALRNAQKLEEAKASLEHYTGVLSAVRGINQLLTREEDQSTLLDKICKVLSHARNYERAYVLLLDEEGKVAESASSTVTEHYRKVLEYTQKRGFPECLERAVKSGRAQMITDTTLCVVCDLSKEGALNNSVAVPLYYRKKCYGVIMINAKKTSVFDDEEIELLEELGGDIAFGLHKIELEKAEELSRKRLQEAEERFELFMDNLPGAAFISEPNGISLYMNKYQMDLFEADNNWIGKPLSENLPKELADSFIEKNRIVLEKGYLEFEEGIRDKQGKIRPFHTKVFKITRPDQEPLIGGLSFDVTHEKQILEKLKESEEKFRTFTTSAPVAIMIHRDEKWQYANPAAEKLTGYSSEELAEMSIWDLLHPDYYETIKRSVEATLQGKSDELEYELKVILKDGSVKWAYVISKPITLDKKPAILVSGVDVTALKEAESEASRVSKQLAKSLETLIESFSRIVEMKDPYTAGHQKRVSELASAIASELGLEEDKVDAIRKASLLHDMGKIYTPSEILNKPGKLSDLEMMIVREHPSKGYDLLKNIDFSLPVAEYIYQHHERFNGSGYPRGLTGDQMLPESKILAVADVVEAMSSHRPYRPSLGIDKALSEIRENAGTLYDSDVVKACIHLFDQGFRFTD